MQFYEYDEDDVFGDPTPKTSIILLMEEMCTSIFVCLFVCLFVDGDT